MDPCPRPRDTTSAGKWKLLIYGSAEADGSAPADLDECSGHFAATPEYPGGVYHYHASLTFPNLPTCLTGTSANNAFSSAAQQGIGAPRR
ncbi:YHYH protein [Deinococcus sp. 14RED07]|nr:YHYH protein [Deinococcus sp. 14RED07]